MLLRYMQFSKYFAFLISLITRNAGLRHLILIISLNLELPRRHAFVRRYFQTGSAQEGGHTLECVWLHFMGCSLILNIIGKKEEIESSTSNNPFLPSYGYNVTGLPSYVGPNETGNQSKPSYSSCFLEIYKILRRLKSILFFAKFYPCCFCSMESKGLNGVLTTTVIAYLQASFPFQILHLKFVIILPEAPQN